MVLMLLTIVIKAVSVLKNLKSLSWKLALLSVKVKLETFLSCLHSRENKLIMIPQTTAHNFDTNSSTKQKTM